MLRGTNTTNVTDQLLGKEFNCANNEVATSTFGVCNGVYLLPYHHHNNSNSSFAAAAPPPPECLSLDPSLTCVLPSAVPSISMAPSLSTGPTISLTPSVSAFPSSTIPSSGPSMLPTRAALAELCDDGTLQLGYTSHANLQADIDDGLAEADIVLCSGNLFQGTLVLDHLETPRTIFCSSSNSSTANTTATATATAAVCEWQGSWDITTSSSLLIGNVHFQQATNVTLHLLYTTPTANIRVEDCIFDVSAVGQR